MGKGCYAYARFVPAAACTLMGDPQMPLVQFTPRESHGRRGERARGSAGMKAAILLTLCVGSIATAAPPSDATNASGILCPLPASMTAVGVLPGEKPGAGSTLLRPDVQELQSMVDRAEPGATIVIGVPSIVMTQSLFVGPKPVTLRGGGEGTVLLTTLPIAAIAKRGHGTLLTLEHLRFDAQVEGAIGVEFDDPVRTLVQGQDLVITNCTFTGKGSGVRLVNAREPLIAFSRFSVGETGVYLRDVANGVVLSCFLSPLEERTGTRGVYYDGDAESPFSAGLRIIGCTIMGSSVGVEVSGSDFVGVVANVIDYCDLPLRLLDQDEAIIEGNYIGARGVRHTGNAVGIEISGYRRITQHVRIQGNTIATPPEASRTRTGIRARNVHGLRIVDNIIHFWNTFGVDNDSCTRVCIRGNTLLSQPENTGIAVAFPTSGIALIAAGDRSVTVPHGLGIIPGRWQATPDQPVALGVRSDSRTLTITLPGPLAAPLRVSWEVEE